VTRAVDAAYSELRSFLLSGALGRVDRLGEVELAERFGISRTPVREALRRLAADGLVEISPNRGARVIKWSLEDMQEIFELRAILEGQGAEWAATRMKEEHIDELDRLCEQMEALAARRKPDYAQIATLNVQLHRRILDSAASPRLVTVITAVVQAPLIVGTFRQYTPESLARSMSHHRDLAAAIRARDADWAGNTMRSHIHAARASLRAPDKPGKESA
jgi:DNA-binding GntR family transcriptional regulator